MENIRRLPTTSVDLHVAEVIISLSPTEFSFSPFSVGLPLPFHPSGICVGGIKVALLSSKLQISFASVHLLSALSPWPEEARGSVQPFAE